MRVLHLTSHLGGGVGRALSGITAYNRSHSNNIEDSYICLEAAQDSRYADLITASGAELLISPNSAQMRRAIEAADIVQIEWWHHPLMAEKLVELGDIPAHWVVWSHTSGLHYPSIPPSFSRIPHAFIASSTATINLLETDRRERRNLLAYVSSTGGFDDFPLPVARDNRRSPRCGYLGSLSPAKLHPDIIQFVKAVGHHDFVINVSGDSAANPKLEENVRSQGPESQIVLHGFCAAPQNVLPTFDLFIYLLNPTHYGTTENALLEAMACGAVPIVLNNPVESAIVQHGVTGFVVDSPETFAQTVHYLIDHPDERQRIGLASAQAVRQDFSTKRSAQKLAKIYRTVLERSKESADFSSVFGKTPADMFLSCLGKYASLFDEGKELSLRDSRLKVPFLYEQSKSSARQFLRYFPHDARLDAWGAMLQSDEASCPPPL
jgi:glycosyltransferase involved in cell wall biosynthesis